MPIIKSQKKSVKQTSKRLALNKKIKDDLKRYDIIHKNKKGINVLVKFNNEKEKFN